VITQSPSAPTQPDQFAKRKATIGLTAVFVTQFVSFLFINARNIAMPSMIAEFDGMALYSWLIALPALVGSVTTLLFGKLSDKFGRRIILLGSMAFFLSGMFLVPFSRTMLQVIVAMTFMSLGHWPIVPLCASAIGDLFPPQERAKWTGLLAISSWAAAMVGPMLGGFLAESRWGWRGLYYGMIPFILIAAALVAVGVPGKKHELQLKYDYLGTAVMVVANSTLIFGFSWVGAAETRITGVVLLIISVIAWVLFVRIENSAHDPIFDPHLFAHFCAWQPQGSCPFSVRWASWRIRRSSLKR
jgi:MFS family permease